MSKPTRKILSLALAVALTLSAIAFTPQTAIAADVEIGVPRSAHPAVNVATGAVYYGGNLYRVVVNDGTTMTLFRDGSIGNMAYDSNINNNNWSGSEICDYLNTTFLNTFSAAEQAAMPNYGTTETRGYYSGADIDITQQIVLPSYDEVKDSGTWGMTATSRNMGDYWWLRSPGSNYDCAAFVFISGNVDPGYDAMTGAHVSNTYAIRPAFKLNLSSVIFTSVASGTSGKSAATVGSGLVGASAPTGAVKLTVLDSGMASPTLTLAGTTNSTDELRFGYTGATTGTNQYVSCVLEQGGTVTHYGKLADCASSGNGVLSIDTSVLTAGTYTLKVFCEQANGDCDTDYAGTQITMTVTVDGSGNGTVTGAATDSTLPAVSGVSPSTSGVTIGTNTLSVTFSEAMNTTVAGGAPVGSVSLSPAGATLTFQNWTNNGTTANYTLSGLANSTAYTYSISGFEDAAGNVMTAVNSGHSFTTEAQPTGPVVSPTTLNLDLSGNPTGTLTISLGQSGNQAAQADITVDPAYVGDISVSPASLNADGFVTVTGLRVVSGAALTAEFSGLDYATPTSIPVTVNVTDSTPTAHSITLNQAAGGMATSSHASATAGTPITLGVSSLQNYYSFVRWDVSPAVTWTSGSATSASAAFTMPDANVTVTPVYSYNYTGGGGSSSGDSYTPPVVWPVIVTAKPDFPTTAKLTLSQSPDKNNALTYTITKDMVQQALDKAKEKAKADGRESYGYSLEFDFSTTSNINSLNITFNADALALLESAGVKETAVITNTFRFGLDLAAIKQLNSQSGGRAVTLSASRFSKLSDAAKAYIGSRPAWDITISFKKDGKTENITSLGKGFITMGMKYTPVSTEKTGNLAVVYVPGSGKPQVLTNSSYDNGWMIWQRSSLSVYGVGYITPAPAFTDTANHWAKENIDFVASRGLISGTTATIFSPDVAITRADFLMALGKLSGADVSGYKTSSFTDVSSTSAAMPYIEWAVKNKIVQGIGDNKFGPDSKISRQDMAVMMVNYAKATGYTLPVSRQAVTFADDAKISAYAKDAVKAIQQTGVIVGKSNNLFDPQGNATRAEASTILRRFVELVIDEGTARGWVQNDAGQWQYINTYGKAVTSNWLTAGENKYYFDDKGVMVYGKWLQIGGKWYYFDASGKLAVNTTIDGYEVGADGARK